MTTNMSSLPLAALAAESGFIADARFFGAPAPAPDPATEAASAWAEGHAAGRAEAENECAALIAERDAAQAKLKLTLARLDAEQEELLRSRLYATIEALCEASLAPLQLDRDALLARVKRAAAMLARADDERVLRLHPDDMALIGAMLPDGLEVRPDPALERGALRLESANGGVEDGPAHWRRAIAEALAQC
ncbi:MAG: FliH/SctL family protein [Novosphingobium sp.]